MAPSSKQPPLFIPYSQPIHRRSIIMTRSHKFNDKDHSGLADGTAAPQEHLPRFFAKSGYVDVDPKKTKKNGAGRGNWGNVGEEAHDEDFNFTNARRRSNSLSFPNSLNDFKTKFDVNEPEPVFEESIHGPDEELAKTDTSSSVSVEEEKVTKDV
ncbi:hypothetical protein QBC33DRAFT_511944 [Phialemonium atrogriseum]|uniref:Hyaluronan/mRNA-binding protein domain-containing protein n=1 Tax=Phialemonium atrogriseum TaxID=1093897 RepID=A0AAJ0C9G3_9PEZI|nr:uncharacterized protein QBC33DRAFT_511944 [Phialemonium atrogriseum]KAK1771157.1 hypothetical protein QBC33DRAFT_511944 [Phialemonium atrogriseum]